MVDIFHYPFPLYRLFFCPANRVWGQTPQTDAGKLENANDLLNSIENEELLAVLEKVDKLTLEMLAMQMLGYSTPQICCRFNVTAYSYYNRIKRLKEKLKKFFRSD